jgi:hypothetical protein
MEADTRANPNLFTQPGSMSNQERHVMERFAVILGSINSEGLAVAMQDTPMGRVLSPIVIAQAVKTVLWAGTAACDRSGEEQVLLEDEEKLIAAEFLHVIQEISKSIARSGDLP